MDRVEWNRTIINFTPISPMSFNFAPLVKPRARLMRRFRWIPNMLSMGSSRTSQSPKAKIACARVKSAHSWDLQVCTCILLGRTIRILSNGKKTQALFIGFCVILNWDHYKCSPFTSDGRCSFEAITVESPINQYNLYYSNNLYESNQ